MPFFILVKGLLFFLVFLIAFLVREQYILGRKIARREKFSSIKKHREGAWKILGFIFSLVASIKFLTYAKGGVYAYDALLITHIVSASTFALCVVVMTFFMTGIQNPKKHKMIAYIALVVFIIMEITAVPVIYRL